MVIFPMKKSVGDTLNAVFQCSVGGNPKPTVTWFGKNSTPLTSPDGRLEVRQVTFDDAGEDTCIGRNLLGIASQTAVFNVERKFHFLLIILFKGPNMPVVMISEFRKRGMYFFESQKR